MAPGALHPPLNTRRRHCVHAFAAGKSPGNPHKTDLTQQRNGSSFEKPKRDVRGLYCTALCLCGARGRATHPRPAPRCLPCPSSSAPCRAALSVASPFALLLPLRAAASKKKQRRASTSTPGQGSQPTQTTKRTRPEQQSIGARALPPELLRLTVTPRVPPPPPRPPPAASRRHLRSASLGSDPSRHVRPPLLLTPER